MKKIYLTLLLIGFLFIPLPSGIQAQSDTKSGLEAQTQPKVKIEGLRIFPNPAPAGSTIYITSDLELTKTVTVYNVLGKKVFFKVLIGKELDISHLNPGIYVMQIKEGEKSATRKLSITR